MAPKEWCSLPVKWAEREDKDDQIVEKMIGIKARKRVALIARDNSASRMLMRLAGMCKGREGNVSYAEELQCCPLHLQYVPNDIVCYTNLQVWQFLKGMAMAQKDSGNVLLQAEILLSELEIDKKETLLQMTFEDNRLVAMIQALMWQPDVLLLHSPYEMMGEKKYRKLCAQLAKLCMAGSSVVMVADSCEHLGISCHEYYFLQDDIVQAHFYRKELPELSKVITLQGGSFAPFSEEKRTMLVQQKGWCRFLYRESNSALLTNLIVQSGCRDFAVDSLTMEEEVYADYERWMV